MGRQLPLQIFHLQGQRLDLLAHQGDQSLQVFGIVRQGFQRLQHGGNILNRRREGNKECA